MKESISISHISQQQLVHPDAIHARAATIARESVTTAQPWDHTLRPVEADELAARPIGLVALDTRYRDEAAHVGHVFVKEPVRDYAEISTLYVYGAHGGQGIGGQLVGHATANSLLAGYVPSAYAANPHAQAAFEHLGFRPAEASELPFDAYNPEAVGYVFDADSEQAKAIISTYLGELSLQNTDDVS